MTRIRRNFILTSAALIIAAAVCLTLFYRHVAVQALILDAEADNKVLAYEMASSLSPKLENFLAAVAEAQSPELRRPLPVPLAKSIAQLLIQRNVTKIAIYNQHGKVAYSSDPNELGADHATDAGVRAALARKVANEFQHKDTLSRLDSVTARGNTVQSYIPVVFPGDARVIGAFEVHSDANELADVLEHTELQVMLGGLIGFSLLAGALIAAFRRAGDQIDSERQAVEKVRRKLSRASLHVLRSEETARKKIATDLESSVVQSLSAVKLSIETAIAKAAKGKLAADDFALASVIPVMHKVIAGLSSLAAELHPASVLELGLLPALRRVCDEFQRAHRSIIAECAIQVAEDKVPQHLKIMIYRAAQAALEHVGRHGRGDSVKLSLAVERRDLQLRINLGRSKTEAEPSASAVKRVGVPAGMEQALELVALSGGTFSAHADGAGGINLVATWLLDSEQAKTAAG